MNKYFPAGYEDIDKEAYGDEIIALACEMFGTDDPDDEELHKAALEMELIMESREAKYL
jgi:hypothetical protein